jgi:hypothetical protein
MLWSRRTAAPVLLISLGLVSSEALAGKRWQAVVGRVQAIRNAPRQLSSGKRAALSALGSLAAGTIAYAHGASPFEASLIAYGGGRLVDGVTDPTPEQDLATAHSQVDRTAEANGASLSARARAHALVDEFGKLRIETRGQKVAREGFAIAAGMTASGLTGGAMAPSFTNLLVSPALGKIVHAVSRMIPYRNHRRAVIALLRVNNELKR